MEDSPSTRRNFLRQTSVSGLGLMVPAVLLEQQKPEGKPERVEKEGENISPAEDLMREHGVLNRILLIYDFHVHKLAAKQPFDGSVLASAADIVRRLSRSITRNWKRIICFRDSARRGS